MSCEIIFIRHGQSQGNLNGVFLGHTDLDLSPLGFEQVKHTAKFLNDIHIDKVYTSDLMRAYHTCCAYLNLTGKIAEKTECLREIYAGLWENKSFDTLRTVYKHSYDIWLNDIGSAAPDQGETVIDLQTRVVNFITKIAEENPNKTIAMFTHATVIRAFFNYAYGNELSYMKNLKWATNASISIAEYTNGKFNVLEYSKDFFLGELKSCLPTNV